MRTWAGKIWISEEQALENVEAMLVALEIPRCEWNFVMSTMRANSCRERKPVEPYVSECCLEQVALAENLGTPVSDECTADLYSFTGRCDSYAQSGI